MKGKNKVTSSRNTTIDLFKFIFTVVILVYHVTIKIGGINLFSRGLLAVDFFFLVSGIFFFQSIEKDNSENDNIYRSNLLLIWKKYKTFFPFVFTGFSICLIFKTITHQIRIHTIFNSIWSLLLLQMTGMPMSKINNQTWYLSVMLLSMFILFPIIKKNKNKFLYYYGPLIIVLGFGFFNKVFVNFNNFSIYKYFIYNGFLRGFCEICLGCEIYNICKIIDGFEIKKGTKKFLTIIESLGWIFIIICMNKFNPRFDLFIVLVLSVLLVLCFSKVTYLSSATKFFKYKMIDKFNLALYCTHIPIMMILQYYNDVLKLSVFNLSILVIFSSILFAVIITIIYNYLFKLIRRRNV